MLPSRIQCSRKKGARLPADAVYVGRPTKWGNPFKVTSELSAREAIAQYERALTQGKLRIGVDDVRRELRGRALACWCKADQPCHADVLLRIANTPD